MAVCGLCAGLQVRAECPPPPAVPTPELVQQLQQRARDHGFLWRIEKSGRTSWLYGTIHVAREAWMAPGPTVLQALARSDTLALELDLLDPGISRSVTQAIEASQKKARPPLGPALIARVQRQAELACVPWEQVQKLSPAWQLTLLTMAVGQRDGLYAAYAIDAVLAGAGHRAGKQVISLETPELQIRLLDPPDDASQIALAESELDELESGRAQGMIQRMAAVWEHSRRDEMEHFRDWCECLRDDSERAMMKAMLDDRNPALAEQIDRLHSDGHTVFAAVGSLHMFGPAGLPALLAQRGYAVTPVEFARP